VHNHFIGIGGIGMSALATILLEKNESVSGSDLCLSSITQSLSAKGASIFEGHSACRISKEFRVIYSSATSQKNPEFDEAKKLGAKLLHRSELLNELTLGKKAICITGAHGKTTTTALVAHLLVKAKLDPSYVIGGEVCSLGGHGHLGKGQYFVLEADESDGSFLKTKPHIGIITNIEPDHLDYWGSVERLKEGYKEFAELSEHLIWCKDDPTLSNMKLGGKSYGLAIDSDFVISDIVKGTEGSRFKLNGQTFFTPLLGEHNVLNSAAALVLALSLGLNPDLSSFKGVARRLEWIKKENGVDYFDDYAHHPTEIKATLSALKEVAKGRIITIFQPHRYSRTKALMQDFQTVLNEVPNLILTPIYSAKESFEPGVFEELCDGIKNKHVIEKEEVLFFLKKHTRQKDTVITLGAGDITHICR
jgi:UDP-N-acetylmuramate--alanine ligase